MGPRPVEKKQLSARGLLQTVRQAFLLIKDSATVRKGIDLVDCLMSGLAIFSLKMPSLLQFEEQKTDPVIAHNLRTLYAVTNVPCDTYLRERLDPVNPRELRKAFTQLFTEIQRGKVLEDYVFMDGHVLMPIDATGYFASDSVSCDRCCKKVHKDGKVTYYHQVLAATLVHPDHKEVFPLCPEPITKADGSTKNDCERNASFRFLEDFRREHPHLKTIVTYDAISANGPFLKKLKDLNLSFIIGVKPDGNKTLFEWIKGLKLETHNVEHPQGESLVFRFINNIPLNDAHPDLAVNYLECTVTEFDGTQKQFSWVTNFTINQMNVEQLARGGRARWKIENEVFNTLKNQGYHLEHNYGHGKEHLSTVFAFLMFLAFLIDQIQQHCCGLFKAALKKKKESKKALWKTMGALFISYYIKSWEDFYLSIANGFKGVVLKPDSS